MKRSSIFLWACLMVILLFSGSQISGVEEEPLEGPEVIWTEVENIQMEVQILPGEDYSIEIDPLSGDAVANYDLYLSEQMNRAVSISPEWLRKDLRLKFRMIPPEQGSDLAQEILDARGKETLDEIAFVVAHLSRETIVNENFFPGIVTHNAELIYENDELVPFANITERDDHTTIVYQTEAGELELPRDMYYWYVVHPDIGDEIPTYVDPNYVYTEDPERDRNKGTPPPEGKFWREYFMEFNKTDSPLLPEMLNGTETLIDGIKAINGWISQSMTFTSDEERPIQPVRIYTKGIGRCGEYQDMRSSAARSCLIPVVPTSNSAEDHVWNEFWMGRWIHWDGTYDRPYIYESGWGKTLSTVWNMRGDGWTWDVTDTYTETSTIKVNVEDLGGKPVDGTQVEIITEMFYMEDLKTTTNFGTTGPDGKLEFMVGDNRNYWGAADGGDLGKDPLNPNVAPAEIEMNSSVGEEYQVTFQLPRSADEPNIQDIISAYPEDANYRAHIDFEVVDHVIRGRNEFTGDRFEDRNEGGDISFFIANDPNIQLYDLGAPFQGFHYSERVVNGSRGLLLEGEDNWHFVFHNGYSQNTFKTVRFNFTLYGKLASRIQVNNRRSLEVGDDIEINGAVLTIEELDGLDVMIEDMTGWIPVRDITIFREPGILYYSFVSLLDSGGMEPGEYIAWCRAYIGDVTHFSRANFTLVDTQAPEIRFDDVSPGPYFNSGNLEITGLVDDNHMVGSMLYYIDTDRTTRLEIIPDEGGNWSIDVDLSIMEFGDHSITLEATDPSGNVEEKDFLFEVIEGEAPMVSIYEKGGRMLFRQGDDIPIEGRATDNVGIDSLEVLVDERKVMDITSLIDDQGEFSFVLDSSSSADGPHLLNILATDLSGNQFSDSIEFYLDGVEPELELFVYGTPALGPRSYYTVTGETSDENGIGSLMWSVDGDSWVDVTDEISGGEFEFEIGEEMEPEEGVFELIISSTDIVGNKRTERSDLYYDAKGPFIDTNSIPVLVMMGDIIELRIDLSDPSGLSRLNVEVDGLGEVGSYLSDVPLSLDIDIETEDLSPDDIEIRIIAMDRVLNINEEVLTTRVVSRTTDTDGDGMPDWWEFRYGLDMERDDSGMDLDNDGISNLDEYLGNDRRPGNDDYSDPTLRSSTPDHPEEERFPFATLLLVAGVIMVIGAVVLLIIRVTKKS